MIHRNSFLHNFFRIFLLSAIIVLTLAVDSYTSNLYEVVTVISENDLGRNLQNPSFVFADNETGEIYILTAGENQLVVYDADYLPLLSLGPGRGIDAPTGLFVDKKGLLYVCQRSGRLGPPRLTILNAAFLPLQEIDFSQYLSEKGEIFSPQHVVVNRNGKIYITGSISSRVLVLDDNGKFLYWYIPGEKGKRQKLEHEDTEEESGFGDNADQAQPEEIKETIEEIVEDEFEIPEDLLPYIEEDDEVEEEIAPDSLLPRINSVTADGEGKLYFLSEELGKIFVHDENENFLFSFGTKGGAEGKLSRPKGIALDEEKGFIYVVDYMRHTILAYDLEGRYQFEIGGKGGNPGWFNFPNGIGINQKGLVFVADFFNHRIQVLRVKLEKASFEF